ncbi:MAG TPA: peptide MFS transporter [Gemmatimonadales bacterium]|nr:peptide MFS transporter [Gemmatimonadales bacterium]
MTDTTGSAPVGPGTTRGWFGHPRGLSTLFFTEMWERFSYYGMRAFLILYMTAPLVAGGLGFDVRRAGSVYGTYTSSAWAATVLGGFIADRGLGQYASVLVGGIIIALGHFTLAFRTLPFFYTGLALIVVGTGLLKPNVSTLVGSLYDSADARRDAGFSIYYMGINLGAALGPLVAGWFAQQVNWHLGFACAGIGMTLGLMQYVLGKRYLAPPFTRLRPQAPSARVALGPGAATRAPLGFSRDEWRRIGAMVVFFCFATFFWAAYEQAGSTLNLFGDRFTRLSLAGVAFPSSWFVAVQAIFVILLAPVFAWLWVRLGHHEPSSPAKFALGLLFIGLSFLLLIPAAHLAQGLGLRVSPWWLIGCYFVQELGELSLSPVGLSVFTKLAPARIVGMMMGVWFLADALGNKIAGWTAGLFTSVPLTELFGAVAAVCLGAAAAMVVLIRPVRGLMGGVR